MTADTHRKLAIADFDYHLPPERIAQEPLADRAGSRLMVLDRESGAIEHHVFRDLPDLLRPGDLLVVNDSKVIPARLLGHRETGGAVELLLLRPDVGGAWLALAKPVKRIKVGETLHFAGHDGSIEATATLVEKRAEGQVLVKLDDVLQRHLDQFGHLPLPPYITHQLDDESRYQTIYAHESGSAAAPTAGLHFTDDVLGALGRRGIGFATVTLHVGLDTFRPVSVEFAEDHEIHSEWCSVSEETWNNIQETRARGGRVVAVGTTSARTLESLGQRVQSGQPGSFDAFTRIYITPGYEWTMVDLLITNFHLPKSTLLLMISSLAGREHVLAAYEEAIREEYRFFSFGDAMLIK
ncbi:MAG: tRNA preQ1(34) S-adenosylmethionine ribosyltransferase-isomerase QueA [Thermomicrobiales bacterium]|nr:tRNA preQ1(34) S-adenosylmethionine ribosyltransferase-isomerase QueA [Thermomicrobiales bacterium]